MKKNFMEHKGYQGSVHYNDEDQILYGRVMFVRPLISYEGTDVKSLAASFEEAVDDYLALCEEEGKKPEVPLKGSFNVRTRPDLHRKAVIYASQHDTNLNTLVTEALEHYLSTTH